MLELLQAALSDIANPEHLLYLALGVCLGLSVGIFPGLGGIAGLALVLPFLYGVDPVSGLALMVGLVAVIPTSDTFSSILMGIPGSSSSQATILDGFPLAKQGQATRALSAAFISSLFGGIFGAIILTFLMGFAKPIILSFRTPELLMLTVLGLVIVGSIAERSLVKCLSAIGLGMLIRTIGEAPAQGSSRVTFESWYLQDGFALVIVGLAVFAIPEIVDLLRSNRSISKLGKLGSGWREGFYDWWRNKWLSFRTAGVGTIIGIIPGLGGSVVDWIAYGHAIQTTPNKENFGKGEIRGVIAPESANNSKEGGGLLPTLVFGIPGSGSMAIFLGGMTLLGLEAGPSLFKEDLSTTYTIVWSLAFANIIGTVLCVILSPYIARLTIIRFPLVAPFILMLILFASFQSKQSVYDIFALFGLGIVGIFLKRFGWSRPAFLIGFVLAYQSEVYTYQVVQFSKVHGLSYIISPVNIIILAAVGFSVWAGITFNKKLNKNIKSEEQVVHNKRRPELYFTGAIWIAVIIYIIELQQIYTFIDKIFPMTIAIITWLCLTILLIKQLLGKGQALYYCDHEIIDKNNKDFTIFQTYLWFVLLMGLTLAVGFFMGCLMFLLIYFPVRARTQLLRTVVLSGCAIGLITTLAWLLNRELPPGILQYYVELPWPLR
ncbi:hypothetical protein COTS27_00254 [Spirochaetota bacterium]|nr:hypothetical protein COTS27_00254 [Spirochaetota bacterium]